LGDIVFHAGWYVYCGSGMGNLFARVERHRRASAVRHWHVDYLNDGMNMISSLPIVGDHIGECELAARLRALGGVPVPRFGASDCACGSHLIFFRENPLEKEAFWDFIGEARLAMYE